MKNINKLFAKLNWSYSKSDQLLAIDELSKCDELNLENIIQDNNKDSWLNIVILIDKIGYPKNLTALHRLLFLLKDMNWTGASESLSLLERIPKYDIIQPLEFALNQANKEDDTIWITGLCLLINHFSLNDNDFLEIKLHEILSKAEW